MPNPTKPILLILLFLLFSNVQAQDKIIDSIKIAFQNPKIHDTTKMRALEQLKRNHYSQNQPNYYYINDWIGKLANRNLQSKNPVVHEKSVAALANYYSGLANQSYTKGEIDKSIPYLDKVIALYQSIHNEPEVYNAIVNKATYLSVVNEYEKAISSLFMALKYYEKNPKAHNFQIGLANKTLGTIYARQGKPEKSIELYKKAISCYDAATDRTPHENDYSKAIVYGSIGTTYYQMRQLDQSSEYYDKAFALAKKIGDSDLQKGLRGQIGQLRIAQGKLDEAEKIFTDILSAPADPRATAHANISLGRVYLKKKEYDKATLYSEKGLALSTQAKALDLQDMASNQVFNIAKASENYKRALEVRELNYKLKDSSKMEASKNALAQQQLKYDFEKKELQQKILEQKKLEAVKITAANEKAAEASKAKLAQQQLRYDFEKSQLNDKLIQGKKLSAVKLQSEKKTAAVKLEAQKKQAAQKNILISLSGVLLLLILGGIFYYRNSRQRQSIAVLEKNQIKQKLLITQMNPHFIFNSVQNIRNLIDNNKNNDAVNYLDRFSTLTRQILENSNENYISLEEEVQMIENYMVIQQLLYNHKFDFQVTVEDSIEQDSTFLPPMLTQPFIENAIKHGLSNKTANGMIDIGFYLKESKLFFEVSDNGKGFDSGKSVSNHKSLAMTITKERLVGYTKNQDFSVQTDNIKDHDQNVVGAKVSFEIPYIYEN